jgi:hypothetical protein
LTKSITKEIEMAEYENREIIEFQGLYIPDVNPDELEKWRIRAIEDLAGGKVKDARYEVLASTTLEVLVVHEGGDKSNTDSTLQEWNAVEGRTALINAISKPFAKIEMRAKSTPNLTVLVLREQDLTHFVYEMAKSTVVVSGKSEKVFEILKRVATNLAPHAMTSVKYFVSDTQVINGTGRPRKITKAEEIEYIRKFLVCKEFGSLKIAKSHIGWDKSED